MSKTKLKIKPWCPFCGQAVGRPQYPDERKIGEFALGSCVCGAVYASEQTGYNVGAAIVECLVHACGDNWDLAWELLPEEDYLTGRIENYDEQTHQVVETRNLDGRLIRGVLYFIRLHESVADITERLKSLSSNERKARNLPAAALAIEPQPDPQRVRQRATKKLIRQLVDQRDEDGLVALCFDDKKTLRMLTRLLYEPDEGKRWLLVSLIGKVCARVSTLKPGLVSSFLHLLFEACSDSAASTWGAIETIGEIITRRPDIYGSFAHHLLPFAGDPAMRVQVLWALGSIAKQRPDIIRKTPFYDLIGLLNEPNTEVRGQMLRLLGRLGAKEVETHISAMQEDTARVTYYEEGEPISAEIGLLAREALELIQSGGDAKL